MFAKFGDFSADSADCHNPIAGHDFGRSTGKNSGRRLHKKCFDPVKCLQLFPTPAIIVGDEKRGYIRRTVVLPRLTAESR
jgi:hypothetical protein